MLDAIRELAEQGMTMLIATHEMGFARDVASRVCFLHDGRILEEGPPEEIFAAPKRGADTPVPPTDCRRGKDVSAAARYR